MPGFALTPASGFPPPTPDDFPTGIQFQFEGENLGGPDVTTINFVHGDSYSVTRGVGENAGVLTIALPFGTGL